MEPAILELLRESPEMAATVIAERIGWEHSIRVLRERVAELRWSRRRRWSFWSSVVTSAHLAILGHDARHPLTAGVDALVAQGLVDPRPAVGAPAGVEDLLDALGQLLIGELAARDAPGLG